MYSKTDQSAVSLEKGFITRSLGITVAILFLTETEVMLILPYLVAHTGSLSISALINASAVTLMTALILWFFVIRPLRKAVRKNGRDYELLLDHAANAIITIDEAGIIQTFNKSAERILGHQASDIIGQEISRVLPTPDQCDPQSFFKGLFRTNGGDHTDIGQEVLGKRSDGSTVPLEVNSAMLCHHGCTMFTMTLRDNSERKQTQRQLESAAAQLTPRNDELKRLAAELADMNAVLAREVRFDSLTKLLTRGAWEECAQLEHERHLRSKSGYAVIMVDVDYFKAYNDTQGHPAGDDCLRRVATTLATTTRGIDLTGRFGGEEFVVLLPDTDEKGAKEVAERLRVAVYDLALPHSSSVIADRVTISIGLAAVEEGMTLEDVIRGADESLYHAKRGGRNRVCTAREKLLAHEAR